MVRFRPLPQKTTMMALEQMCYAGIQKVII